MEKYQALYDQCIIRLNLVLNILVPCPTFSNVMSDCYKGKYSLRSFFSLFLNDIEMYLQADANAGIKLDQLSIHLLMFADDAVIFSETIEGLQESLNNLKQYCDKWNLSVNIDKTEIMVFRKGGVLSQNETWTFDSNEIEIVNNFNYLGVVLSSGGSYVKATNTLAGKALKAINSLMAITKEKEVPIDIMLSLFYSFVGPILNYGCEVWGFERQII